MDQSAFPDFPDAATAVLRFLQDRLGFGLWMVTRTVGDDWIVLHSADRGYDVGPGDVFRWSDTFCSRMVAGEGPHVSPRSREVPGYAEAAIGEQIAIKAYIGVPLSRADGSLFGTLCAVDPEEQPESIVAEQPLVEVLGRLLSTVLERDLDAARIGRRAQQFEALAMRDELTGLPNRRAWEGALAGEEERCRRFGHPAAVVSIDLDGLKRTNDTGGHEAGDALLRRAATVLRSAVRAHDTAARTGGDEFALLVAECGVREAAHLVSRLTRAFSQADVEASVGIAVRAPGAGGLQEAWHAADAAMYASKARRKVLAARR